jgi:hypothetical protein
MYFPSFYIQTFSEESVSCVVVPEAENGMGYALACAASVDLFDPACFDQGSVRVVFVVLDGPEGSVEFRIEGDWNVLHNDIRQPFPVR